MREMLLGILLAFCQHWAFSTADYRPYEDVLRITTSIVTDIRGGKHIESANTYHKCMIACLLQDDCLLLSHNLTTCNVFSLSTVNVHLSGIAIEVERERYANVGLVRDRATKPVVFRNVEVTVPSKKYRGGFADRRTCFAKCDNEWSCTVAISSGPAHGKQKCYTADQIGQLKYKSSSDWIQIAPRVNGGQCGAFGGVTLGTGISQACRTEQPGKMVAQQCERFSYEKKSVLWYLGGSSARCTYSTCDAKKVTYSLRLGGNGLSGYEDEDTCTFAKGKRLKAGTYREVDADDKDDCKEECDYDWPCNVFGFVGSNKKCRLAGGSVAQLEDGKANDEVTFLKRSKQDISRMEPCVFRGFSLRGGTKLGRPIPYISLADCWDLCLKDIDCNIISIEGWNYECQKRSSYAELEFDQPLMVSAFLRDQWDSSCLVQGAKLDGKRLNWVPIINVHSQMDCESWCYWWQDYLRIPADVNERCYAYQYNPLNNECDVFGFRSFSASDCRLSQTGTCPTWIGQIQESIEDGVDMQRK